MAKGIMTECERTEHALRQIEGALGGRTYTLDLELVRSSLHDALAGFTNAANALRELSVLREDLAARIRGMQSAIAVATDSSDGRSAETLEELVALGSVDLIKRYRITCGRFRDTFPGRLTYLSADSAPQKKHNWTDYQT